MLWVTFPWLLVSICSTSVNFSKIPTFRWPAWLCVPRCASIGGFCWHPLAKPSADPVMTPVGPSQGQSLKRRLCKVHMADRCQTQCNSWEREEISQGHTDWQQCNCGIFGNISQLYTQSARASNRRTSSEGSLDSSSHSCTSPLVGSGHKLAQCI